MNLYDPSEHRDLAADRWDESAARAALEEIATDAVNAYQGPDRLWPNHVDDLEGDPDVPYRNVYFGAAGMAWALDVLARDRVGPELPGQDELTASLAAGFRKAPELVSLAPPPAPSLLFGESGILLAAEMLRGDGEHSDALEACIRANAHNPTREMCWGSPGTMVAALRQWRSTGEGRWRELWLQSAAWLLEEWREVVWTQDMYGERRQYVGAGHGFAGNAFVLLAGTDLLGDQAPGLVPQVAATLHSLAHVEADLAQWPPLADAESSRQPVQWCHGSPGMVTSLAGLPRDDETDRLLTRGAQLTWQAGPLRKGVGLCHGTAGNAYAFLALHARLGDERWLERARAFAMDAAADLRRRRTEAGRGRYSLFTGDIGVALLLRSCLSGDAAFPFLG